MADISSVIFDLDGVLVDSREWHFIALKSALLPFGVELDAEDHARNLEGLPTLEKLDILRQRGVVREEDVPAIHSLKQQLTRQTILDTCKPRPPQIHILRELVDHGLGLAVCTNATRQTLELVLERGQLAQFFRVQLSNEDVTRPKPDPEIFLEAMRRLGCSPAQTLIIEDSAVGIAAAKATAAHVMQVPSPEAVSLEAIMERIGSRGG